MKTDIFEDMKDYIGCNDVSDLPYRKREVWEEIKRQLPLKYPKEQLLAATLDWCRTGENQIRKEWCYVI